MSIDDTYLRSIDDLAIFGGPPAFSLPLHVGKPNLGDRTAFLRRVGEVLDRQWLTNDGPLLAEFEQRIAERLGVGHCVAVCNGTMALAIAARAAGLENEVIVPSFTFVATAHALDWHGISPVFADVDARTHHIDPEAVERAISPRTSGIVGVHTWGRPCDIEALLDIGSRHGLVVLFDAAPAFGCTYRGHSIGGFGKASAISFHATKVANAIEGGAILTDCDDLAARARLMRSYGFVDSDTVVSSGTNAKMSEISAAMGLTSLESYEDFRETNYRNYLRYRAGLSGVCGVRLLEFDEAEERSYHNIVLEVDESACLLSRDLLQDVLTAENVLARRYFFPGCHRMEPYRSRPEVQQMHLETTDLVAERVLSLPTGSQMSPAAVDTVCRIVRLAVQNGALLSTRIDRSGSLEPLTT